MKCWNWMFISCPRLDPLVCDVWGPLGLGSVQFVCCSTTGTQHHFLWPCTSGQFTNTGQALEGFPQPINISYCGAKTFFAARPGSIICWHLQLSWVSVHSFGGMTEHLAARRGQTFSHLLGWSSYHSIGLKWMGVVMCPSPQVYTKTAWLQNYFTHDHFPPIFLQFHL